MSGKILGNLETDLAIGTRADAAAVTANTASIVSLLRAILVELGAGGSTLPEVIGELDDVAKDTTDVSTAVNLLRQIAEAVNKGTGTALAANKSLVDVAGTDGSGNSLAARIGNLTDAADATPNVATLISLARELLAQIGVFGGTDIQDRLGAFDGGADPQGSIYRALGVDAVNSVKALVDGVETKVDTAITGIGTADGKVDTAITDIGTVDGKADTLITNLGTTDGKADTLITNLGTTDGKVDTLTTNLATTDGKVDTLTTNLATTDGKVDTVTTNLATTDGKVDTIDSIVDALLAKAIPSVATKTIAFDGGAGTGGIGTVALFTVTGGVKVKLYAICTETLVGAATLSCGTAGEPVGIIAQVADATIMAAGEIWFDATPTTLLDDDSSIPFKVIGDGADIILTIAAAAITDGTIEFRAEWQPLTAIGALVAA